MRSFSQMTASLRRPRSSKKQFSRMNTDSTDETIIEEEKTGSCCSIGAQTRQPTEFKKKRSIIDEQTQRGMKCMDCREYESAAQCFEKVLSIKRELHVEPHMEIASTLEFLANVAAKRRLWKACQQYWSNALDIYVDLLGYEHEKYLYALGKEEHAARKAYLEKKKSNLFEEVQKYTYLARLNVKAKKYEDAHIQLKKALGILKMCMGINSLKVAAIREMQADICIYQGKYTEARSIYKGVLRVVSEKTDQSDESYQSVFRKLMSIAGLMDEDL